MLKREAEWFGEPAGGGEGYPMSVTDLSKAWENIHKAKSALRHIENRLEAVNAGTNLLDLPVYQKSPARLGRKIPRAAGSEWKIAEGHGVDARAARSAHASPGSARRDSLAVLDPRSRGSPLENGVSPTHVDRVKTSLFPRPRERHRQPGLTRSQLEARWLLSEQTRAETEAASEQGHQIYSGDRRDVHSADFASVSSSVVDGTDVRILNDAVALDLLEGQQDAGRALLLNGFARHHHRHHEEEEEEVADRRNTAEVTDRGKSLTKSNALPRRYDRSPPQRLARNATPVGFPQEVPPWMECNGYAPHQPAAAEDFHAVAARNQTVVPTRQDADGRTSPKPSEKLLRLKERVGRRAHPVHGRCPNGEGPNIDEDPLAAVDLAVAADATSGRHPTTSRACVLNNGLTQASTSSRVMGATGKHGGNQLLGADEKRSWSPAGMGRLAGGAESRVVSRDPEPIRDRNFTQSTQGFRPARAAADRSREVGGAGDPIEAAELSVRLLSQEVQGILDDLQLDACIGAFEKNPAAAAASAAMRTRPTQGVPSRRLDRDGAQEPRDTGWTPVAGGRTGAAVPRDVDERQQPDRHKHRTDGRRASRRAPDHRGEPVHLPAPHQQLQHRQQRSSLAQQWGANASAGGGIGSWNEDRHHRETLGRTAVTQAQYHRLAQPSGESDKENWGSRLPGAANAGDFLNNGRFAGIAAAHASPHDYHYPDVPCQPYGWRLPSPAEHPSCSCGSRLDNPSLPSLVGVSSPDSDFYRGPPFHGWPAFEPTAHHLLTADGGDAAARGRKVDRIEALRLTAARLASRLEDESQMLARTAAVGGGGGSHRHGATQPLTEVRHGAGHRNHPPMNCDPGRNYNPEPEPEHRTLQGDEELMRKLEKILGKDSSLRKMAWEDRLSPPAPPESSGKNDSGAARRSPREESYLHALDAVGRSVEKLRSQKRKLSPRNLSPHKFSPSESRSPVPAEGPPVVGGSGDGGAAFPAGVVGRHDESVARRVRPASKRTERLVGPTRRSDGAALNNEHRQRPTDLMTPGERKLRDAEIGGSPASPTSGRRSPCATTTSLSSLSPASSSSHKSLSNGSREDPDDGDGTASTTVLTAPAGRCETAVGAEDPREVGAAITELLDERRHRDSEFLRKLCREEPLSGADAGAGSLAASPRGIPPRDVAPAVATTDTATSAVAGPRSPTTSVAMTMEELHSPRRRDTAGIAALPSAAAAAPASPPAGGKSAGKKVSEQRARTPGSDSDSSGRCSSSSSSILDKLKKFQGRLDERYLTKREQRLRERRRRAKELLLWKQRLDTEEEEVRNIERLAAQAGHDRRGRQNGRLKAPSGVTSLIDSQRDVMLTVSSSPTLTPRDSSIRSIVSNADTERGNHRDKSWRATDNLSEWSLSIRTASESECSSEVEGRIVALRDELARRKMMVERLQKEQRRRARERLRAHESSLRLQLQAYDTFICKAQGELEDSKEPHSSLRPHSRTPVSLDLNLQPTKGTSTEADTTGTQSVLPEQGSFSSPALSKDSSAPSDDISEPSSLREERSGSLPVQSAATRRDDVPSSDIHLPAPANHEGSTFTSAEPSSMSLPGGGVCVAVAGTPIPSTLLDDAVDPSDTRAVLTVEVLRDEPASEIPARDSEGLGQGSGFASSAQKSFLLKDVDGDVGLLWQTPDRFPGESERASQLTEHRDEDDEVKIAVKEGADMPPCWEVQDLVQIGSAGAMETHGDAVVWTGDSCGGNSAVPEPAGCGFGRTVAEPLVELLGFVTDELPRIVVHTTAPQTWENTASSDGTKVSNSTDVVVESWSADFWQEPHRTAMNEILPNAGSTPDSSLRSIANDVKISQKSLLDGELSDSEEFEFSSNFSSADASDISSFLTKSTSTFESISSPKGHDLNLPSGEAESGEDGQTVRDQAATTSQEADTEMETRRLFSPFSPRSLSHETGEDERESFVSEPAPLSLLPSPNQSGIVTPTSREGPLAGLQLGEQLLAAVTKFVDGVIAEALKQVSETANVEAAAASTASVAVGAQDSHADAALVSSGVDKEVAGISGADVELRKVDRPAAITEAAAPEDADTVGVLDDISVAVMPGRDGDDDSHDDSEDDDDNRSMYSRLTVPDGEDSKGTPSGSVSRRTSVSSVVSFSDTDEGTQPSWLMAYAALDDQTPYTPLLDMLAREKGRMQTQRVDGIPSSDATLEQLQQQDDERRHEELQQQEEEKQQELQQQKRWQEEQEWQKEQELQQQSQQEPQQEEQRQHRQEPANDHKINDAHAVANGLIGRFVSEALDQYLQLRQARNDKITHANTLLEPVTPPLSPPLSPPRLANRFTGYEEGSGVQNSAPESDTAESSTAKSSEGTVAPESHGGTGAPESGGGTGAPESGAGTGALPGDVEPEEMDFETERAFPPEPTARPVSPECDLDSSEDLSTPLAQLRLSHALLEAGLLQDDQDWFDEDFGLSNNRRALQQQQQSPRAVRFGDGARLGSPDSVGAAAPAGRIDDARVNEEEGRVGREEEEDEEEALFAVPHSRPEVTALVSAALSELDKLTELGESAWHVMAPRSFLGADCRGQDIESVSRRVYKQSVFDLTKEVFMELHADDPNTDRPPWMKPRRGSSLYLWRIGGMHSDGEIAALIQSEVLRSLGLFEGNAAGYANAAGAGPGTGGRKPDLPRAVKWGKKSRDRVDIILARDLHEEEPQWVSYEDDELEVKMQAVDSIFEALLADTAHTLSQIYDNRAQRAAATTVTSATAR